MRKIVLLIAFILAFLAIVFCARAIAPTEFEINDTQASETVDINTTEIITPTVEPTIPSEPSEPIPSVTEPEVEETEPTVDNHPETMPPATEPIEQPTEAPTEAPTESTKPINPVHEHHYKKTVKAPTCENAGYDNYACDCGESYKENYTKAVGHNYSSKTVAPTSSEKGYDLHTCSNCGKSYKDNYTDIVVTFQEVNETVYAKSTVNVRKGPSTDYEKIGSLSQGESATRIGIGDNNWSKIEYKGEIAYVHSDYLQTTKPPVINDGNYPLTYSDGTCTITIYKEWYKNAYCYAAHLQFTDYTRFGTNCANGKYNNGYETTSHAAKRLGAIFAVNGCYSAPYLDYTVVRDGKIWNGADRNCWLPGVYSKNTGLFQSAWESGGASGVAGVNVQKLVDDGTITDTFCFGPPNLINGVVTGKNEGARAQRTMIGTNGNPGDIWIVVSDGRYNDGASAGLTFYEGAEYLLSKGCTFGIHLDGGGSSTMYFNGKVLNAARGGERAVVDFVYFK